LNNWDVSNVEDMTIMFYDAPSFNQPLNTWNVLHAAESGYMGTMFHRGHAMEEQNKPSVENYNKYLELLIRYTSHL
jgi:hypothetical protein